MYAITKFTYNYILFTTYDLFFYVDVFDNTKFINSNYKVLIFDVIGLKILQLRILKVSSGP